MLRIGMFIADRYEILAHIGTGGMSEVYKAKCHKLNRFVAVKVLKTEFSSNPDFVVKFRQEAQSAAILSHPNIVSIYDVGDENDLHYIVMELIEGITLKDYISSKGKLDIRESIGITIQVAQGLAAAHEQHIIHRDIKPQNIIISKDAKVKVMDFGIARATSGDTINSNSNMGSVHYISPEQARGGYCDERSDLYSLGISLYEMVTGAVPFDGENTVTIALAHIQNEITAPRELEPSIPISLEKIIMKCTMKKPERRYSSAMELIGDLRKALIMPEEDFVKVVPPVNNNPTKMISPEEINAIRDQSKVVNVVNDEETEEEEVDTTVEVLENGTTVVVSDESANEEDNQEDSDLLEEEDEEEEANSKFDIIVLIIGIILAIVIIVLAIFLGAKIIDMNKGGNTIHTTVTEGSSTTDDSESETPDSKQVKVPSLLNMTQEDAEKLLKEKSLGIKIEEEYSEDVEEGIIIRQNPEANNFISKFSTITVYVSKGSEFVTIPSELVGKTQAEVQNAIYEAGLYSKIVKENSDTVEAGLVISVDPEEGSKVSKSDIITVTVSLGKEIKYSEVPNLTDKTPEEAQQMLTELELNYAEAEEGEYSSDIEEGHIISQDVEVGTEIEQGSTITVVISKGVEKIKIEKDMTGESKEDAEAYFKELGFEVKITEENSSSVAEGKVISQSVEKGSEVLPDEIIKIIISKGPETVSVPYVIGKLSDEAIADLMAKGFKTNTMEQYSDSVIKGCVISQSPESGQEITPGSTITIVVSLGPEPTPEPTPTEAPTPEATPEPTPTAEPTPETEPSVEETTPEATPTEEPTEPSTNEENISDSSDQDASAQAQ